MSREQVVDGLLADESGEVPAARLRLRGGDVPTGEVAAARVEDLALRDGGLHRLPDLVPRRVPVDVVELVDVDVVGLQPLQARVERATDVERREPAVVRPVGHVAVQLGREHGALAPPSTRGEPVAHDLLGDATPNPRAVHVGRVEEVDAVLVGGIHDDVGVGLRGLRAEVHGAEAETRDLQA